MRRSAAEQAIIERPDAVAPEPVHAVVASRSMRPASASEARIWRALLVGGAAVAFGLFGREVADLFADRRQPALFQHDLYSALGSLAMLAIIGAFAYVRARGTRSKRSR